MKQSTIFAILFMAIGMFSTFSSLLNWDFFFNSSKAKFILSIFGRQGARIFYGLIGITIFSIGFLGLTGYISLER